LLAGLFDRRIQILVVPLEDVAIGVASSTRPTKMPAGASRAAANQTSIDWPSVVPASSSRFVNSLRRVTVALLAATGSR
jgi:hypothetical protein